MFKLQPEGLTLIEIAPGVDLRRDVLDLMEFEPIVSRDLCRMEARIFDPELMGLKADLEAMGSAEVRPVLAERMAMEIEGVESHAI